MTDIGIIILGYLLGAIPSAYIIGRLWGKVDLRKEGDGHISATALARYIGKKALALAVIMDIGKAILAILVASRFTDSQIVLTFTGYAVVIGHCWSVFLGFKGGLGGTVVFGTAVSLAFKETFIGVGIFLIILFATRKSSWGTFLLLGVASVALLIERANLVLALYPLGLIIIHWIKRYQTQKANPQANYANEVFDDLKSTKLK